MHILFFTEKAVKYSKYDPRPRTKCHLRLQKTEPRPRLPFQIQTQSPPGMCAIFAWYRLDPRRRPSRSPDKVKKDFSTA